MGNELEQLVLPQSKRRQAINLAHQYPWQAISALVAPPLDSYADISGLASIEKLQLHVGVPSMPADFHAFPSEVSFLWSSAMWIVTNSSSMIETWRVWLLAIFWRSALLSDLVKRVLSLDSENKSSGHGNVVAMSVGGDSSMVGFFPMVLISMGDAPEAAEVQSQLLSWPVVVLSRPELSCSPLVFCRGSPA